ncbi:hypothetical protein [Bifidobacterium sp. SO1]|uniref:hypothetical protein n=1 Tax=Bifidobacterium sp. SO1 TaxID=2809029 RepID=UPI001BDD51AC|nr:hypothetical protein [Bifidobacterium sp. SO1]MBT1161762.1 hypothetical protein [Bifidobacterium sp. SO1]
MLIGFRTCIILNEPSPSGTIRRLYARDGIDDILVKAERNPPLLVLTGADDRCDEPHCMLVNPRMIIRVEDDRIRPIRIADDDPDPNRRLLMLQMDRLLTAAKSHFDETRDGLHWHGNEDEDDGFLYEIKFDPDGKPIQTGRHVNAMRLLFDLPRETQRMNGIVAWANDHEYLPVMDGADETLAASGLRRSRGVDSFDPDSWLTMITFD